MTTVALNFNWNDQGTSFRLDVMSMVVALALHVPLFFMKFNANKNVVDHPADRLVSVDLIDPATLAPPAPPPPAVKSNSMFQKLKMLVHREPPPPPPPPKVEKPPEQLNTAQPQIKIQPNLKLPEPVQPKLESKSGFKTAADAKLIEDKQLQLKTVGAGSAPLSEKKFGTVVDRGNMKSDKGNFKIASNDSLKSIGGNDGSLSGGSAPTIAINSGARGSTEKFTAPPPKADKGKMGAVGVSELGGGPQLGFRDAIIARDAKPGQIAINSSHGVAGGVPGGVDGGVVGGKKDAGRFEGGQIGGVLGGTGTGVGTIGGTGTTHAIAATSHPVQKKSMFTITGPLSNRAIITQVTPEYPAWAQAQGIEASVILEFTVLPDGSVKEDIVVRRTTGYPQLDQSAIKALRRWKFVPVSEDRVEVGQITFNFSLR